MFRYVDFDARQGWLGESMTVRRRKPASPGRAQRSAVPDDTGDKMPGDSAEETGLARFAAAARGRVTAVQRWLARYEGLPAVDVVLGTFRRDRRAAGAVMSSALAFRLFVFFLPLLLLTIGVAGFASDVVDARSARRSRSARHFTSPGSPGGSRCCSACGGCWWPDGR